jgi:hypothetical protein
MKPYKPRPKRVPLPRDEARAKLLANLDRMPDSVIFNFKSADLIRADGRLAELITHLAQSKNVDDQLVVELRAGQQYLKAPRARRDLLDELIVRPLRKIKERVPTEQAGKIASEFLDWFLSHTLKIS